MTRPAAHVVILVENLPVPFDRRPWQIARSLTREGCAVSVICPRMYDCTALRERLEGIDIYRYPSYEGSRPLGYVLEYANAIVWMLLLCLRLWATRGIDAIHACNPPDLLFLIAWPFKAFFGTRFIFDHHDLVPEIYLAKYRRRDWIHRILLATERMTYRLCDVSIETNLSFRRLAIARARHRPDRTYVVRNAPWPGRLVPGRPRQELRCGRKHLVAYLGVMNKQDGVDLLLESAAHLKALGRDDVVFGLIGDGPEVPALKAQARRLGLNGEIQFLGRISDGRILSDYLNTATVCVCPDPRNEMNDHSTMTKVVEYMALGKPIVAYNLAETLYSAGDAALYATDNNARQFAELIVQLLNDAAQRRDLGRRARRRYEEMLAWPIQERQLLAAYRRVFDLAHGPRPAELDAAFERPPTRARRPIAWFRPPRHGHAGEAPARAAGRPVPPASTSARRPLTWSSDAPAGGPGLRKRV